MSYQPAKVEFRPRYIERLRIRRGISRKQLAQESGIHVRTLYSLENKPEHEIGAPTAKRLADFFGLDPVEVLEHLHDERVEWLRESGQLDA